MQSQHPEEKDHLEDAPDGEVHQEAVVSPPEDAQPPPPVGMLKRVLGVVSGARDAGFTRLDGIVALLFVPVLLASIVLIATSDSRDVVVQTPYGDLTPELISSECVTYSPRAARVITIAWENQRKKCGDALWCLRGTGSTILGMILAPIGEERPVSAATRYGSRMCHLVFRTVDPYGDHYAIVLNPKISSSEDEVQVSEEHIFSGTVMRKRPKVVELRGIYLDGNENGPQAERTTRFSQTNGLRDPKMASQVAHEMDILRGGDD